MSSVFSQSMGFILWSNFFELPSFHFRKMVQRMKTPPIEATTAMRMVAMLLLFWSLAAAPAIEGGAVSSASTVLVTTLVDACLVLVDRSVKVGPEGVSVTEGVS